MRSKNKVLSSILAALLIAGNGTMVFAKDFSDVDDMSFAKTEIDMLSDIGVIKGTGETEFSPEDPVTREQMAAFLFRLMLNKEDAGRVNTTRFTDLYEPYYNGVISWANASGYILGTSSTTFEPTNGITLQDAMAMLVRALGQEKDNMNAGYPWSYINAGIKLGLDRGLEDIAYDQTLTRAQTAVLLYNAMTSEYLVGKTTVNGNVYYESTSLIEEVFGYDMADAVLVSTNTYTTGDNTVVKNGYVSLACTDGEGRDFTMTVPYEDMKLSGTSNDRIGQSFRVIFQKNGNTYQILSAVEMSRTEEYTTASISDDEKTVTIGDNKYTLVDEYSDALSTNNNELILYAYDDNGTLEQIETIRELKSLLGFYRITLIYESGEDIARRAVLRGFEFGRLDIAADGKINLADGLTEDKLTGGFTNPDQAQSGDYVLYYFNDSTKELEIGALLDIVTGTVRRITADTVKLGDDTYALGNTTAGISAESIRDQLSLGSSVHAVIWQGAVIAIHEGNVRIDRSEYLVALSDAHRIYENGSFRYVATVSVDGETKNVYVKDGSAREGEVYRYTVSADTYTLIAPETEDNLILSGKNAFIQNDKDLHEMAYIIDSAADTAIAMNSRNYFTLEPGQASPITSVMGMHNVSFVTDEDTLIVVNNGGTISTRKGTYNSTIQVNDGASVTAVFNNETGSVETLRYLYISDGKLGNYDVNAEYVRILAINGSVLENGRAYIEYTVYNFDKNIVETRLSESASLQIGEDYRTGSDSCITTETAEHIGSGFVSGFTASTVTIDGTTYTLADDVNVISINDKHEISKVNLGDLYMHHVEFVIERGEATLILAGGAPVFAASGEGMEIEITTDFDIRHFDVATLSLTGMKLDGESLATDGMRLSFTDNGTILIESETAFQPGLYTVAFTLGGSAYQVSLTMEEAAQPETPETPEVPETPEQPEDPEVPETPEQPETPDVPETPENGENN
ncbi:MAG: S-layer homology domain-containing protein [Clostridia bacterium]|nr:S-layer homology domain-containing protein [Clostridia bacterium]